MVNAFIMRLAPSGVDHLAEALELGDLIIGWSDCEGLLDKRLDRESFRQIIHDRYHGGKKTFDESGQGAGNMWRFIREMSIGDLIVAPEEGGFHLAKVAGPARYLKNKVQDDSAYRRRVDWLFEGALIPRDWASSALKDRMTANQTVVNAGDLVGDIREVISKARKGGHFDAVASEASPAIGPMKVRKDTGEEIDATFRIERREGAVTVVIESRGGTKGVAGTRNTAYQEGLQIVLDRLSRLGAGLSNAIVDSAVTKRMSAADRSLVLQQDYPIHIDDPAGLRKALGRAQAAVGRKPGAKGPGNPTKRLRLYLTFSGGNPDPSQLAEYLLGTLPSSPAGGESPHKGFGTKYRAANETPKRVPRIPFEVDPDAVERGTRGHAQTQNALADFLQKNGIEPHSSSVGEPEYDLGWETKKWIYVAEVKSLTLANEEKQLRLGLGQVLRYRHVLASRHRKPVRAVLVAERRPIDATWSSTCRDLDILLVWPEEFGLTLIRFDD
jgi:hypothetical protein